MGKPLYLLLLRALFFCFIGSLICKGANAQETCITLTGKVTDSLLVPLQSAIVIVGTSIKKYYVVTNEKGNYEVNFCVLNDSEIIKPVSLTFRLIGYHDKTISIKAVKGKTQIADISLRNSDLRLQEVIVQNQSITQRGDTTGFKMSAFKNKLDVTLEDALRKMPGFDIDESGRILYDNKPIETILIEGDELAKNYKLISRNIPPDAIDRVDMINKYEANPLLKGLTGSRKQAMNLILKNPNHVSTFGNVKGGAGITDKFNLTGTLFGINKNLKNMILGNANNTGTNPYEEIILDQRTMQNKDYEFDNTITPTQIDENRLFGKSLFSGVPNLFNNSRMAAINNSIKISNTLSVKLFSNLYTDRISQSLFQNFSNNLYPTLSYTTNTQKTFLPSNYDYYLQFKFLNSKQQFLFTTVSTRKNYAEANDITTKSHFFSNQQSQYNRKGIAAFYTNRIDTAHLFEISFQYTNDSKKQEYNIKQDIPRNIDTINKEDELLENTASAINYFKADARFLFKKDKLSPSELRITNSFYKVSLKSYLEVGLANMYNSPSDFANDNQVLINKLQILYRKEFGIKKVTAGISLGAAIFNNTFDKKSSGSIYSETIQPLINGVIRYKLGSNSDINYGIDYNSDNASILTANQNPVLNSFRTFTKRELWNKNLPFLQSNLTYVFKNLNTGTSLIGSWVYYKQQYSEISNIKFSKDFDFYTNRFSNNSQDQHTFLVKFDQYISKYKTAFSFKQSFSWYSNPMELNNTILSNRNFIYSTNISFRPTLGPTLSINTGLNINYSKDIQSLKSTYQLNPFANTIFEINNKLSAGVNCSYYTDNYSFSKSSYYFINSYLWYSLKKQGVDIKLSVNNILNTHTIFSGSRNNLYSQYAEQSILPRFTLLEVTYKF